MQNHARLKALRHALKFSVADMAHALGLTGSGAADKVRAMENGARDISGPLLVVMDYLQQSIQQWTKTPPAMPGYYWQRFINNDGSKTKPELIKIVLLLNKAYFYQAGAEYETPIIKDEFCEYCGPIAPPIN